MPQKGAVPNRHYWPSRHRWRVYGGIYLLGLTWLLIRPQASDHGSALRSAVMNGLHIPAYAFLTWPVLIVLKLGRVRRPAVWTVVLVSFYGIGMEMIQSTVPGRTASLSDIGLNTIGVITGIVIITWVRKWNIIAETTRKSRPWKNKNRKM